MSGGARRMMSASGPLDLRLAIPAAIAWCASGLLLGRPDAAWLTTAALSLAAVLAGSFAVRPGRGRVEPPTAARRIRTGALLPLLALSLGAAALPCAAIALQSEARAPAALVDVAGEQVEVVVELDGASPAAGRRPVPVHLLALEGDGVEVTPNAPAVVFGELPSAGAGAVLRLRASLRAAEPGAREAWVLFAGRAELERAAPAGDPLAELRSGLRRATAAAGSGADAAALLPGLAVGDTGSVPADLVAAMRVASLTHLTAVSGANCAVVIGLVLAALAGLGLPRGARIVGSLAALVGFVALVTPQPSVLRAAVMAGVVLLAVLTGRPARGLPVLGLAVLVLLVVDPWFARDFGFVLSVAATAALLLLAPALARRLARWLPAWLAIGLAVPIAAQLVCQPILILLQPALPGWGVVANLLAEPAAPVATVLGLAACLLLPVVPPVGEFAVQVALLPAGWIAAVARAAAAAPGATLPWLPDWSGAALLAIVTALAITAALARRRTGVVAGLLTFSAVAAYAGVVGGGSLVLQSSRPTTWQYAACEVGQGDAMLIRSEGRTALVDTGPDPAPLAACLDELGIARLDLLVLTHFDKDHVGGTDAILGRVDTALVGASDGSAADRLVAGLAAAGARIVPGRAGLRGELGGLDWRVLWPPVRGAPPPGNAAGIVLLVEPGAGCSETCLSGLFLADLGDEAQRRMLADARPPPVDVIKVAHHGSADQDVALYAQEHAAVALIGVGAGNDYGHPTARALDALAAAGTAVTRTDREGLVLVGGAPAAVEVWTERDGAPP